MTEEHGADKTETGDGVSAADDTPEFRILVDIVHERRVCFALQQNAVPFLRQIRLCNVGSANTGPLSISVSLAPAIAAPLELTIGGVAPDARVDLPRVDVALRPAVLGAQTEREVGEVIVRVTSANGSVVAERRSPFEVLAYDEWPGTLSLPEILAAFVLPNHPRVETVLAAALPLLEERTGRAAFDGYQSQDPQRALAQAASILDAIGTLGLAYANPPASYEEQGQKIRTPERIAAAGLGTCLDLVCFAAACLEQAGLHALLVMIEGHAFCGVWLEEESFPEPTVGEPLALVKRAELDRIALFETTGVTLRPPMPFAEAMERAAAHLADPAKFIFAVDVHAARRTRIRPLPTRITEGEFDVPDAAPVPRADAFAVPELEHSPAAVPDETPATRIDRWKRRLLDLTARNRLIAHRETKKTVPLLCPDLPALEDALADGRSFRVLPPPKAFDQSDPRDAGQHPDADDPLDALLRQDLAERRLRAALPEEELERRLLEIFRAARSSMEESGANTLYLALGFLEWFETEESAKARRAPLLLIPLSMDRTSVRSGFRVRLLDDDARINVTLLRKLEAEFGIEIPGVNPPPQDEHGLDVPLVFRRIREAVLDIPRWTVREDAVIGLFSFTKFLMWLDLDERTDFLTESPVVRHLVESPGTPFDDGIPLPDEDAADAREAGTVFCPTDADSSQLRAILAAEAGKSFVLQGPPGTGKSQTITNLIAHCLAAGQRVLFVAEKRAALDVVHRRLARVGLDPFCLAVHSNKARKRDVLESLGEALRHTQLPEPEGWRDAAARLVALREELNAFAAALHRPRAAGLTAFGVLSQLIGLRDAPHAPLAIEDLGSIGANELTRLRESVGAVAEEARALGDVTGHALLAVEIERWEPALPERVREAADALSAAASALLRACQDVAERAAVPPRDWSTTDAADLREWGALMAASPAPEAALVETPDFDDVRSRIEDLCRRGRERDRLRDALLADYRTGFLTLEHDALVAQLSKATVTFWPLSWFAARAVRNALRPLCANGTLGDDARLIRDLETATRIVSETEQLSDAACDGARFLGDAWRAGEADWDAVERTLKWVSRVRDLLTRVAGDDLDLRADLRSSWLRVAREGRDLCAPDAPIGLAVAALDTASADFDRRGSAFTELLVLDAERAFGTRGTAGDIARVTSAADTIADARGQLRAWAGYHRARAAARTLGAGALVMSLERGIFETDMLTTAFERSFCSLWAERVLADDPLLADFSSTRHGLAVERFRDLDRAALRTAAEVVRARLSARLPSGGGEAARGSSSEVGILNRELQKRARHKPIRRLFEEIPNVLARIKPCLLMSPLSVAQYLGPGVERFDLVVFDEASQIPVWDAVGAIARGERVVVVGDSKQLPPTSFFEKSESDEWLDEDAVEDLESILDECVASGLPELRLRWHYRSRHESLITFSNQHYYDGRLLTFPNAAGASSRMGVSFHEVPGGVYDRARTRTNRVEAEALVADVVARLLDPREQGRTIGVVTFSMAQQTLIEDMLEEARRATPEIEPFFTDEADEAVFVKNLESVQGDERDVILFSVGYGPDATGRVSMNFGPLNRDGGERRLNVAVTRAREQVVVFSTLLPEQIDLVRTRAVGVADLKRFLEYARRGAAVTVRVAAAIDAGPNAARANVADPNRTDPARAPTFAADVARVLRAGGHAVDCAVGSSEFRIDLAVRDADDEERHALGILLDGASYAAARTARDRERLREEVLGRLGWQLHHVWALDWWYEPEREAERLLDALRAAREAGPPEELRVDPPKRFAAAPDEPEAPPVIDVPSYASVPPDPARGTPDGFASPRARDALRDVTAAVLASEAPITEALLIRRVAAHWGVRRVTAKVTARIRELCGDLFGTRTDESGSAVLWGRENDPTTWDRFRPPGADDPDPREAAEIPLVEIANAARHVLRVNVSMSREDLARRSARVFRISRLGSRVKARMLAGIRVLIERGDATEDGDRILLAD